MSLNLETDLIGMRVLVAISDERNASQRPIGGLILVTPFDSLKAREHYPWAPVGLLLREAMAPVADRTALALCRQLAVTVVSSCSKSD